MILIVLILLSVMLKLLSEVMIVCNGLVMCLKIFSASVVNSSRVIFDRKLILLCNDFILNGVFLFVDRIFFVL